MLKQGWFNKFSVGETIRSLLHEVDSAYMNTVTEPDFEKGLIDEVRFIGAYNKDELIEVEKYIHEHRRELYQEARRLARYGVAARRPGHSS